MIFKDLWILFLIPLCCGFVLWLNGRGRWASLRFPSLRLLEDIRETWKTRLSSIPQWLRIVAIVLFLIGLAGPRFILQETISSVEGIDIILTIDCSGSMAAEDFQINGRRTNRLEVVKKVVDEFIANRPYDRMALVAFAGVAYPVSPLTLDHNWLINNLNRIELGFMKDGTAIGSAINSSLLRLRKSDVKSKIVILLTDGVNNAGKTDPLTAAEAAKTLGIKIYTIGVGTKGYAPFPIQDLFGQKFYQKVLVEIDEVLLRRIAELTGGKYFRATDMESLRQIYEEIDALEKTKIEEHGFKEYKERFDWFVGLALLFLFIEFVLSHTVFLRIP